MTKSWLLQAPTLSQTFVLKFATPFLSRCQVIPQHSGQSPLKTFSSKETGWVTLPWKNDEAFSGKWSQNHPKPRLFGAFQMPSGSYDRPKSPLAAWPAIVLFHLLGALLLCADVQRIENTHVPNHIILIYIVWYKTVRSSQRHFKAGEPEPRFRSAQASTDSGSRLRMIPSWSALKRHRPDHDRTSNTLHILP